MPLPRRLGAVPSADCKPFLDGRRGLPKELQIPGDLSMSHKLLVEAFAAQNPPTSYHAELPRKLEIWLVPQVRRATGVRVLGFGWGVWSSRTELLSSAATGRGVEGWGQGWC